MDGVTHEQIDANGVSLHVAVAGQGPLIVLLHGFPGLWYSWRHQLPALAAAGYRVAALDMRGYGRSGRPIGTHHYSFEHTSADVLCVLEHFGEHSAVVFGHDFGANLAWHLAVHHPDRIRAIASLCVPYGMALAGGTDTRPSELYAQIAQQHFFHMHYYQHAGVAEASCIGREKEFLAKLFWALCAEGELLDWVNVPAEGTAYIDALAAPPVQPPWPWLSAEDFDYYVQEYLAMGSELAFAGGINAYRAMDCNWERFGNLATPDVLIPALYVGGAQDPTVKLGGPEDFDVMHERVKDLRGVTLLPAGGHFIQQEQPDALNKILIEFLAGL
ncbi:MAG: alpha/beta fold hydrolase [Halioglobus sp.]